MPKLEIPRSSSVYPDDVSPVDSNEGFHSRGHSYDVSPITDPQSAPAEIIQDRRHVQMGPKKSQTFGGGGALFSRKLRPAVSNRQL